MKTPLVALACAMFLGACVSGGAAPAQSGNAAQSSGGGACDKLPIHTVEQYDNCRNQCRNDKSTREQQCNADSNCLMANGAQTQKCFAKCDEGRDEAKAQKCFPQ